MSGIQLVLHSPVAARFGLCLVHFLWQGAALALLAVLLLALLRRGEGTAHAPADQGLRAGGRSWYNHALQPTQEEG